MLNLATFQQKELNFSINARIASLLMLASIQFGFGHSNANMAPQGPRLAPLLNFTTFQQNELKFSINAHIASLLMLASIRFGFGHMNANMAPQGLRLAPHAFFGHISIKMSLHFQ